MAFIAAAITLGFLGSFHCIGMCGPIALALPVHHRGTVVKYLLILMYNAGRIITYSVLGIAAGLLGKSIALAGLQQALSISIGILLLSSVIFSFKGLAKTNKMFMALQSSLSRLFSRGRSSNLFLIGLLNGLLPCGLVYMALAGALATGDIVYGMLFMTGFGIGTVPMMLLLPLFSGVVTPPIRQKIQKAIPIAVSVMAVLLIVRGLNLGIPYLSPKVNEGAGSVSCHSNHQQPLPDGETIHCRKPSAVPEP